MTDNTKIEWTDATWNPVTGCTEVSPGCDRCYAKSFAERWRGIPGHYFEQGFDVQLRPNKLDQPLRWSKPRRIFVNSMSDLFHDEIPDDFIAQVFAVMARSPQHTFQLLTKRHGRMRSVLRAEAFISAVRELHMAAQPVPTPAPAWPLPNVWLGVSVENQQWADIRIPALLATPAAVRFLSCEPLLGPVTFRWAKWAPLRDAGHLDGLKGIDWVIVGGESGHGARPMHPEWARSLRDQCTEVGVAFHFKQWGEWAPAAGERLTEAHVVRQQDGHHEPWVGGEGQFHTSLDTLMRRPGKKHAGRELDGRTWDEFPEAVTA